MRLAEQVRVRRDAALLSMNYRHAEAFDEVLKLIEQERKREL